MLLLRKKRFEAYFLFYAEHNLTEKYVNDKLLVSEALVVKTR